jgi:hypothetical protein
MRSGIAFRLVLLVLLVPPRALGRQISTPSIPDSAKGFDKQYKNLFKAFEKAENPYKAYKEENGQAVLRRVLSPSQKIGSPIPLVRKRGQSSPNIIQNCSKLLSVPPSMNSAGYSMRIRPRSIRKRSEPAKSIHQSQRLSLLPRCSSIPVGRGMDLSKLPMGSYRLDVQATDSTGKSAAWRSASFTVEK